MAERDDDRFLEEAVSRGLLTREQAEHCRRIAAAISEVDVALTLDEILARKGFLARERSAELRRSLARQRVGRYEILERLGEGGSGVVWKARDVVLDRVVALKLLSREARDDPAWRERFLREARTAVTLNHVGLVRGLDCGEADGYLYFTMEYVAGESVAARLHREGRLPEREAIRIAAEVVQVLRYVSGLGIVHRDIKPENLLLATDGRVKVCDLGLAKPTREEKDRAGAASLVAGTPLYVAPEQIRDGDRVDWRADVYSLGATLYHLLAGRPPFPWEKGKDLLARHLHESPPSPREFALDVTPAAAAVVLKMLRKDPADRYARIDDLDADLASVLAGRPPLHTTTFAQRGPVVNAAAARATATASSNAAVAADRVRSRWMAAAVLLAAATAVAAGIVVASRSAEPRRASSDAPGVAPSNGTPIADAPRNPPSAPPAPPAPPSEHERDAAQALETARRFAVERADGLRAKRDAFVFVVEKYAGTTAAEVAAGVVADLGMEIDRAAAADLAAAHAEAAEAEAGGRLGDALRLMEAVASASGDTPSAAVAATEAKRLRGEADRRLRELLAAVADDVATRDVGAARVHIAAARALGLPWAALEIAQARQSVDAADAAITEDRNATRPAFERVWGEAVLAAHADGIRAALAALDSTRTELAAWARELDVLRVDLLEAERTRTKSAPGATTIDLRAAFFAHLSRREFALAESLLPRIETGGTRADDLREGLRRVQSVVVARADALLVLAEEARTERRTADLARLLEQSFAEIPEYPRARVLAARALSDRGKIPEAIAELERVLALPAPPPEAHLRLGQIVATQRRDTTGRAAREIEMFLTLSSESDPLRAEALAALERIATAEAADRIADLQRMLSAAVESADHAKVIEAARAMLALSGGDAKTLKALGDACAETGAPHEAYRAYIRAAGGPVERRSPQALDAIRKLERRYAPAAADRDALGAARSLLERGDLAAARDAFGALLVRTPFLEDALAGAAEAALARKGSGAYALSDDPARAAELTEILAFKNPDHLRGMELRAEALLRTGAPKEALALAVRAVALDPLRPDPALTAGFASLALGDPWGAADHFKTSLQRRRTPHAYYGRAIAFEKAGRRQAAREEALMLLEQFGVPDDLRLEVEGLNARLEIEPVESPR
ncbi:MAG: protein kinase [Planctomycetes bacterium]|nr:protein kinase [Planctomycetota bacterium]